MAPCQKGHSIVAVFLLVSLLATAASARLVFLGQQPFRAYVSQATPPGRTLYQFFSIETQTGSSDGISYSVVGDSTIFFLNSVSGLLLTTETLPLSGPAEYTLDIRASSPGQATAAASIRIIVIPESDVAARFEHSRYQVSISESLPVSRPFAVIRAFSPTGSVIQHYSLFEGNTNNFAINSDTGLLRIETPLDRERTSSYSLTVRFVEDSTSVDVNVEVSVEDENDNAPQFSQMLYDVMVREDAALNSLVVSASATDRDFEANGTVSYSLDDNVNMVFQLDQHTGAIHTAARLDYEQQNRYQFRVTALDGGSPSMSSTVTVFVSLINVDDECPRFESPIFFQEIECNPGSCVLSVGMTILTVVASDPDGFSGVTYAIMSGNEDGVLALDSTMGVVTLARVNANPRAQYTLNVSASDLGCINQSFVPVEIGIGNVNNFSPQFMRPCRAELEENPPINTEVVTLVATDNDINDLITYSLVSSVDLFCIDSSGVVRTTAPPEMYDRETRAQFQVGVTASDRGNRKDYCVLTITLLDQNDNAPSFRFPDYNETESTTLPSGTFITKVQADDVDLGSNGVVQYSLVYPVSPAYQPFTIDNQTGIITTNGTFSQSVTSYQFMAVATDSGTTSLSSVVNVTVTLINSNEFPVFEQQIYSESICENTQFFSSIAFVRATSVRTEPIIYSMLLGTEYHSNQDGIFQFGTMSPNGSVPITVSSAAVVDYERLAPSSSFSFYISALNSAGSSQVQMEVSVGDQDDNRPVFVSPDLTYSIVEGMPSGTIVAQLQASDSDSGLNGDVEYRLHVSNFNHPYFTISSDGNIRSRNAFDAESMPQELTIYVEAYNPNAGMMSSCGVVNNFTAVAIARVRILDLNDNPPSFFPDVYFCSVPENETVHNRIFALNSRASDPDSSDSGRLRFFIFSGNEDGMFVVNNSDLILARRLDYEVREQYVVVVRVTDGVYTDSATINVRVTDVDDEPPVFSALTYFGRVIENAAHGTIVLSMNASDVDSPSILYELQGLARGRFSIDGSGIITVQGAVDREEFLGGEIIFLVFAYGGSLATANVRVSVLDVNDYTPRFLESFIGRVQENRAPGGEGLFVGVAQAVDLDEGRNGTVTYSLLSGGDQGFQIDGSTGTLTAHREYNREAMLFYVLNIQAMDDGIPTQLSSTIEITVEIGDENDNKPIFPYPYMFAWVFEESSLGMMVLTIPASDSDNGTNSTVSYTQTSSNPAEVKYDVIADTGEVRVAGNLNYEIPQHRVYNLTISLNDSMFQSDLNGRLEIRLLDRNDNQPVASVDYNVGTQLPENLPAQTQVATIMATDGDSGLNGELVYSISAGNINGDFNVSNTGQIQTTQLLDRERTAVYNLTLTVSDQGDPRLSTTVDVNFEITDLNDEPPVFCEDPYMVSVPENSGPVSSILAVSASDPDSGPGGVVGSYLITGGNEGGQFVLSPSTGVLGTQMELDREQQSQYTLTIVAMDRGSLQQISGMGTVVITVTDRNDNPSSNGGHTQVLIYTLDGHLATGNIAPIYFSDPDIGDSFQNCITNTQIPQGTFDVDRATCTLRSTQDNPGEGVYSLQVSGTDGIHDRVNATVTITVEHRSVSLENILTITVNASTQMYIDNLMSSFPALVSSAVGTDVTVVSVDEGYHIPASTVDVSFYARRSDGSFLSPTAMLQDLYLQRDTLRVGDYSIHTLPTDSCAAEPCFHQAACSSLRTLQNSQVVASTRQSILVAPLIQLDYQCQCIPGTTGEFCEVNFDDCYSNPCLYGAQCTDRVQGFTCDCPQGTNGPNCSVNPDECSSSPCQNGATCRNGLDTHVCDCQPGYYGAECQYHYFRQSSACDSSPCLNGGECSPGRDSYTCLCPRNFTGRRCDQSVLVQGGCIGNPCYNGSTCTDTPSGPVCTCSVGYTGPFCRWPLDNCELEPCRNGGTCQRGFYGSYLCTCTPGYTGENCTQLIPGCDSDPCLNGGRCFDVENGMYSCECTRQFYGNNCEFSIQLQDLCASTPCAPAGNCTHGRDSFTCTCDPTTSGTSCSISSPPATPCDSNPCLHGSTCTTSMTSYVCACSPGFSGTNCEENVDDCASSPCMNGGICTDGINGFICNCPEQITGRQCEVYCPDGQRGEFCQTAVGFCTLTACMNGGTCIEEATGFSCVCPSSHTGPNCDTDNSCTANQCLNGGTCVNSTSGGSECLCNGDFDGERCELVVASFYGSHTESSYRAFDSLNIRGQGTLSFQFATRNSSGLLLYNTQFQGGTSRDYIAVEVVSGHLSVGVSQGADSATVVVMSSVVRVNDGLWHQVNIETSSKVGERYDLCVCILEATLLYKECIPHSLVL